MVAMRYSVHEVKLEIGRMKTGTRNEEMQNRVIRVPSAYTGGKVRYLSFSKHSIPNLYAKNPISKTTWRGYPVRYPVAHERLLESGADAIVAGGEVRNVHA